MNPFTSNIVQDFYSQYGSYTDRRRVVSLTEADISNVSSNLVSKLYKSALAKAHVDFENIPMSRGDITKYSGYVDMMECLSIIENVASKSNIKIKELDVINNAIGNIVSLRDTYVKGYAVGNNFIMLQYCTLVSACVEATSGIIASFVEFTKSVDNIQFTIINPKTHPASLAIKDLSDFNKTVSSGEYNKVCNIMLKTDGKGIVTESAVVITIAVITSIAAVISLMRHIVFRLYYARMKISDYLKLQATFLEMNKANVEAKSSGLSSQKKKEVVKKQHDLAVKLMKWSDKIRVDSVMNEKKVNTELKNENSTYTLDTMQSNPALDNVELL